MGIASADEIEEIANIFDLYNQDYVYYIEFYRKTQNIDYRIGGREIDKKIDPEWRIKKYKQIAEAIVMNHLNYHEIFEKLDYRRDGYLTPLKFQEGLQSISTRLNHQEISHIASEFDPNREGIIYYQRFLSSLEDYIRKKAIHEETLKNLERYCIERSINLEAKIENVDSRNRKMLSQEDFLWILHRIDFPVNSYEIQIFFEEIPKLKDGLLDIRYVLERLPKPKPSLELPVIYEKIKSYIRTSRQNISLIFSRFDKNKDGNLGPYEFSQALTQIGLSELTFTEISVIIQDLDKNKDGLISVYEFSEKLGIFIDLVQSSANYSYY